MSVSGRPPHVASILGVIDTEARRTVERTAQEIAPIVDRYTPSRSGKTAAALRPKVTRTSAGAQLVIAPTRGKAHSGRVTVADVIRYVTRGTGIYREGAGAKALIHASKPWKRMALPGGARRFTVKGQHPNPFMDRIRTTATPRVERAFAAGAREAARAVERRI